LTTSLPSLAGGKVYILQNPSDALWWELQQDLDKTIFLRDPSETDYLAYIKNTGMDNQLTNLVVMFTSTSRSKIKILFAEPKLSQRVFVLSRNPKKDFKKILGGHIEELKITVDYKEQSLEARLIVNSNQDIKNHPFRIAHDLKYPTEKLEDQAIIVAGITGLAVEKVYTPNYPKPDFRNVLKLAELDRYLYLKYFVCPWELKTYQFKSLLYDHKAYCSELLLYYDQMLEYKGELYINQPDLLVKQFFTWVYKTNTVYRQPSYPGYTFTAKKTARFYNFLPSTEALIAFTKLLNY